MVALNLVVRHVENVKFEVECRGHKVIVDQPREEGGSDTAMTPLELLNASLAACVGYYVALFLQRRSVSLKGLEVSSTWETTESPHRVARIFVSIKLPAELSEPQRRALLKTARACTVHNTLSHPPEIAIDLSNFSSKTGADACS